MDLSSAAGALRTLRIRPKVPQECVSKAEALLHALTESEAPDTAAVEQHLNELQTAGDTRWEAVAVVCAVSTEMVLSMQSRNTIQAYPETSEDAVERDITSSSNTSKVSLSNDFIQSTLTGIVKKYLEHYEPRLRMAVANLLGALAHLELSFVMEHLAPLAIDSAQSNLVRSPEFVETGIDPFEDDNISVNGMESPMGAPLETPTTPHKLDDVSGWKALESSLRALQFIMRDSGQAFLVAKNDPTSQPTSGADLNDFQYLSPELFELLTLTSCFHINRHVRVVGFDCISVLCDLCPPSFLESHKQAISDKLNKCIVRGMQDNWSQVRYAAAIALSKFLMKLDKDFREEHYYSELLPRLCLNRYFIAERVRRHSQETWVQLMGQQGPDMVAKHMDSVVGYYVKMTEHAVRESACQCIGELATKIPKDAVRPYVPTLLEALVPCLHEVGALIRDAACLSSSQILLNFPDESISYVDELFHLYTHQLSDEIWSLREDAAVAIARLFEAYSSSETLQDRVHCLCDDYLGKAKEQLEMSESEYAALKQQETEVKRRKQKPVDCCAPAPMEGVERFHEHTEPEPWECTDGAIYLVRELCRVSPQKALSYLSKVADVAILRHFPQTNTLQETIWRQLPLMFENLGKQQAKRYLEIFMDPLVFTLEGTHRLARAAAQDCVKQLSQFIGPRIFEGRVRADDRWARAMEPLLSPMGP